MAHENQPDTEERAQTKSSQKSLLLLLVLVAVLYGYLYFFTGLIRPRPEAPPPQQAQTVVKKPLPPRSGDEGDAKGKKVEPGEKTGAAKAGEKAAKDAQEKGAKPAPAQAEKGAKPVVAKDEKGAKPPAKEAAKAPAGKETKESKPAVVAADKAAKAKAEKAAKPAAKEEKVAKAAPAAKNAPVKPAGKDAKTPAPAKTAAAAKAAPAKPEKAEAKPQAAKAPAAKAAPRGAYTLEFAGDLAESEVKSVTAKLKKVGISGIEKTKMKKGEPMHRLFLADFANKDEAAEELQRLKQTAPSAFMLTENGRYAVYAGSYLREKKAALEQDRLYDKGVKLLLRTATAPVAVTRLRAGSFPNQASAQQALERLKQTGVDAKVVKTGK